MELKIFVIVVTYNGKTWYDKCFSSLLNSKVPVNVVVIDNASNDDSVNYIKSYFNQFKIIELKKNLGFGQGNNLGIRYALDNNADYIFLLNQDAWIESNTISDLIDIHIKNFNFGILSPMHLNSKKNEIESGLMHYIADYRITSSQLINDLYFDKLENIYESKYINAAAWLLPIQTIKILGGFDPVFFHYGEDDNYLHRAIYHGLKIGICPKVRICHDTERRIIKKNFIDNTDKTVLLVKLADINSKINFNELLFSYLVKFINKFLKFNFKSLLYYLKMFLFVMKMKKKIMVSRNQNIKIDSSWI